MIFKEVIKKFPVTSWRIQLLLVPVSTAVATIPNVHSGQISRKTFATTASGPLSSTRTVLAFKQILCKTETNILSVVKLPAIA